MGKGPSATRPSPLSPDAWLQGFPTTQQEIEEPKASGAETSCLDRCGRAGPWPPQQQDPTPGHGMCGGAMGLSPSLAVMRRICSRFPQVPVPPAAPIPGWAARAEMQAAAGSTGAEAVGGQAQPGLFYQRLFPAKKRASDTSTSRGTSCRYPVRGRGAGAPRRGTARLLGLARGGEGAHAGHRTVGHGGRVTSCSRNRSCTTTVPLQHPPSPPHPQPQQTTGSRSYSRGRGMPTPAWPALGSPCSSTAADSYFQIHSSSLFWKSQKITELTAFPTCASTL